MFADYGYFFAGTTSGQISLNEFMGAGSEHERIIRIPIVTPINRW